MPALPGHLVTGATLAEVDDEAAVKLVLERGRNFLASGADRAGAQQ